MLARDGVALKGRVVLIVEDAVPSALLLAADLRKAGGTVLGPFSHFQPALDLLANIIPDAAVLNLDLCGAPTVSVADILLKHDVPFVFASPIDPAKLPARLSKIPHLEKPYNEGAVLEAFRKSLGALPEASRGKARETPMTS
jgi:two-component SAPR family response regulator